MNHPQEVREEKISIVNFVLWFGLVDQKFFFRPRSQSEACHVDIIDP